eukprot:GILJ01001982.1.p1 GENE.GILJ01001982.1~~GILJ01001982.1.p1  ORF type:complete len:238 (-),score=20.92 GILJ01001982.1:80-793(-)
MAGDSSKINGTRQVSSTLQSYLFLYNASMAIAYLVVFAKLVSPLFSSSFAQLYTTTAYADVGWLLNSIFAFALLEVLHGVCGWTGTPLLVGLLQQGGRFTILHIVIGKVLEVHDSPTVFWLFLVWSAIELVRYPFYLLSIINACPRFWVRLRYNLPLVLFPLGLFFEAKILYESLPFIREHKLYAFPMPNVLNFSFDFFTFGTFVLWMYPLISIFMFSSAFALRKRKLVPRADIKRD